jgi:alpha-tubulin suppressor-like RCC1 family protein
MTASIVRRASLRFAALVACFATACTDQATQPSSRLRPVSLALAIQVGSLGNTLRIGISYQRSGNATTSLSLLDQTIDVGVQAHAVPLVVDIAPCLADPQREGASVEGAPACVLHISVTLLDASQQQVDQATLPSLTVHAGDNAQAGLAVGTRTSYLSLAPGFDFTCRAVTVSGGGTTCWGSNRVSQLGKAPFPDFLEISAGNSFTCGRTRAGEAWCWGDNSSGQLGDNLAASRAVPTLVKSPVPFTQIVTGLDFACGLAETGTAYCWGENAWASLGDGTKVKHANPAPVKGGFKFVRLGAGGHAVCGLTDGTVYCWGSFGSNVPTDAQASLGPITLPGTDVVGVASFALGTNHACGILADGSAVCYGGNSSGQLGDGTTTDRTSAPARVSGGLHFTSLTAGNLFTCGLATDGFAYCWGSNSFGQLGVGGGGANRTAPTRVAGNIAFATLVAGQNHVCGSTSSGSTYCWGFNQTGQLGDGSTINRNTPTLAR